MKGYNKNGVVEIHKNLCKGDDFCSFEWMQVPAGSVDNSATITLERKMDDNPELYAMDCLKRTTRIVGALYIFLAKSIVKHLGNEGIDLIKSGVTTFGQIRGKIIREKLRRARKTTTIENIFNLFNFPHKFIWKIGNIKSNERFRARVNYCPLGELWNELGLSQLGTLYCGGIYESMFKVFNYWADIKVPKCMTRGDKHCRFDFKI